jgi:hypothetical protein
MKRNYFKLHEISLSILCLVIFMSQITHLSAQTCKSSSCMSATLVANGTMATGNPPSNWIVSNGTPSSEWTLGTGSSTGNFGVLNDDDDNTDRYIEQYITTGVVGGKEYILMALGATHSPKFSNSIAEIYLEFYNNATLLATSSKSNTTHNYNGTLQPMATISANAPANTNKVRIVGHSRGRALKIDNVVLVACYDVVKITLVSKTNSSCSSSNGQIVVNGTGGTGVMEYSKDNINWQSSGTFSNLAAGSYKIYTRDKNNPSCKDNIDVLIDLSDPQNCSNEICFIGKNNPDKASAKITWTVNAGAGTVTIRATLAKTFVDNTYGTNTIGWPSNNHDFKHLTGSDQLTMALYNNNNSKVLEFAMDYLTASSSVPSGYKSLGVSGGDGKMITGSATNVVNVVTSLDDNFNKFGYILTTNSPATNANYDPNPSYPNWIYDVWYEATVKLSAFGTSGFGRPVISGLHASPSKTGSNDEPMDSIKCPKDLELTVEGNCIKDCSEDIISKVIGGTPPYTYLWSTGAKTKDLLNVCAGTYTLTVTDSKSKTFSASATVTDESCPEYELCYQSPTKPEVSAKITWQINTSAKTVKIRTTFSKTFVDNTYGTNAIGWPGGHSFGNLTGSDKLQLALYDNNKVKKLEFEHDYLSSTSSVPSGYKSLGVTGGDGGMKLGNASSVLSTTTSLDENFNTFGYVLTSNSPSTNSNYDPNPTYPNWIYEVWYEQTVDLNVFGASGFGFPHIVEVHASPSKTGNNTEPVDSIKCPNSLELTVEGNCIKDCSEDIISKVNGGTAPFTYLWSTGAKTKDLLNVCAGTYSLTVTDAKSKTFTASATVTDDTCPEGEICYQSPTKPEVSAKITWQINTSAKTVKIRTTFSKTFVDNTYGTNAIGWPGGHSFGNLTGSDKLQLALYDNNKVKKLEFEHDYLSSTSSVPSGYKSLGVTGGDGGMKLGNASSVLSTTTSLDENFNTFGYVLTSNSPSTNSNYDPNPTYPKWIYEVWYEQTVDLNVFGSSGFGFPHIVSVHASPSKTGNNTEPVDSVKCTNCIITNLTATPGTCNPQTDKYNVTGTVTFNTNINTGTLTISDGSVQQVFNAPFTSPQAYSLTGLSSDGQLHTVTAVFSADTTCKASKTYTSPQSCITCPADACVSNTLNKNGDMESGNPPSDWSVSNGTPSSEWTQGTGASTGKFGILNNDDDNTDRYIEQIISSGVVPNRLYILKALGATHSPKFSNAIAEIYLEFYNDATLLATSSKSNTTHNYNGTLMPMATINFTAPANTNKIRIVGHSRGRALKIDNVILQACYEKVGISLVSKTNITCTQNSGQIKVAGSGGSGEYEFSKDNQNWQTSDMFGDLAAGTYTIHVRDVKNNSCKASIQVTITDDSSTLCKSDELVVNGNMSAGNPPSNWIVANGTPSSEWTQGTGSSTGNFGILNNDDDNTDRYIEQFITNEVAAGRVYTLNALGATHSPKFSNAIAEIYLEFYNGAALLATSSKSNTTHNYNGTLQPMASISFTAPSNTNKIRIVGHSRGRALKLDNVSLKTCYPCPCVINTITATAGACNPQNNTYTVSGQVTFTNAPNSGTLTVQISGGGNQVFNAPFSSPINYSISGQPSDGLERTVTATFSADPNCTKSTKYTAPKDCKCVMTNITATAGACNPQNNTYTLTGQVTFTNAPNSGTLTVQIVGGGNQVFNAPFTSPINYSISGQPADGLERTVTAIFSADPDCKNSTKYTAPKDCKCELTRITAVAGACDPKTNTYSVSGQVTFSNAPNSGTLTVQIVGGGNQVFNAPFTSPINYSISGQPADGLERTVTAVFSADPDCKNSTKYTAPKDCKCELTRITAVAGACNPQNNTYTVSGQVTFFNAPNSGTLTVQIVGGGNQVFFAPFGSPINYSISGQPADGLERTVTAIFSADPDCKNSTKYTAPKDCKCDLTSITATAGACNPFNNTHSVTGQVTFTNPPNSGTLTVQISGGGNQVFFAPFGSPINYSISGQPSDGLERTVTATFSADPHCTKSVKYTAPKNCQCDLTTITATAGACNPSTNNHTVTGQVTFTNPPNSGTLTIQITGGGSQIFFAPFGSPINYSISGQTSDGLEKTITATFSADPNCSKSTKYKSPPNCECLIGDLTVDVSPCDPSTNNHTVSGKFTFTNPPNFGTLTIQIVGGGSQTFFPPFTSPINYSISGQNSDGLEKTITATFSADPDCSKSKKYTSPQECFPKIKHKKEYISTVTTGYNSYQITYRITVTNTGGAGLYNLYDAPAFDDDITIVSANYTTNAPANPGNPGPAALFGLGPWTLAVNQSIAATSIQTFTLKVNVTINLDDAKGDNKYDECGKSLRVPKVGEGLFNESRLDTNRDGIPDARDTACADLPYLKHTKRIIGVTNLGLNIWQVEYRISVVNHGGIATSYNLSDAPGFDNDISILNANYTTNATANPGNPGPQGLVGSGPWTLATNQNITVGGIHDYNLKVTVKLDLEDLAGDNRYDECGKALRIPKVGEGLFNESRLDADRDGIPDARDTACADLPYLVHKKTFISTTPTGTDKYQIVYRITVENKGGASTLYHLSDAPAFDNDVIIESANYLSDAPGNPANPGPTALVGSGPWTLANNQLIGARNTHTYTLRTNVTISLNDGKGDERYDECGKSNKIPRAGEGLFNESRLDVNRDGTPDARDTACADLPLIVHTKRLIGVSPLGGINNYQVQYRIVVENKGGISTNYDLSDAVGFDDDITITAANYTSNAPGNPGNPGPLGLAGSGPWTLATNQLIVAGTSQTYVITVNVSINLEDLVGDNRYDRCGKSFQKPIKGEGLFNESRLDINRDGIPDQRDTACADLPYLIHSKRLVGVTNTGLNSYEVEYKITVENLGAVTTQYHLTDAPGFENDIAILSANYSSNAFGNPGNPGPSALAGVGPWTLATHQTISGGTVQTYTLKVNVSINLDDAIADNRYDACGKATGKPKVGEGLFNESRLDINRDGIPDRRDTACADLPYLKHRKTVIGVTNTGVNTFMVEYRITVENSGNAATQYNLSDAPAFDNDVAITSASYMSNAVGNPGTPGPVGLAGIGPWTLAVNQSIGAGITQTYTLRVHVIIDLNDGKGDDRYDECGRFNKIPRAGEGLFNESRLDANRDGTPDARDTACTDLPILVHKKRIIGITPTGVNSYRVDYQITVENKGGVSTQYNLSDAPAFDDDITITGANYSSNAAGNPGTPGPIGLFGSGPWTLASNQTIGAMGVQTYNLRIDVSINLEDTHGDNRYDECGKSLRIPKAGEGLFNESRLDVNLDGRPDARDTACADLPYLVHTKRLVGVNQTGANAYQVEYRIVVENRGGTATQYHLTDAPGFENDINIVSANYSTNASGNPGNPGPSALAGVGPWSLAFNQSINAGASQSYTLRVNVTINLEDLAGDNRYNECGKATGKPKVGEGLFNESRLDVNRDGIPDARDTACADLPYIIHKKTIVSVTNLPNNNFRIVYRIDVHNLGGSFGKYGLVDSPGFDDDIEILNASYQTNASGNPGNPGPAVLFGFGPWSLANNQNIGAFTSHSYTLTVNVKIDLTNPESKGDRILRPCGYRIPGKPSSGEGLFNQSLLDVNNDGIPDQRDTVCTNIDIAGLGDKVWNDLNGNGIQDIGEPGVRNVIAILYDCATGLIVKKDTTDHNGIYFFENLVPDKDYFVRFDLSMIPSGFGFTLRDKGGNDALDSDVSLTGIGPCTRIDLGERDSTYDAGLVLLASIGDFVWNDKNFNGMQDFGEEGVPNVLVTLYDAVTKTIVKTTSTDAFGFYLFKDLYPKDYYLKFNPPADYRVTTANQGPDFKDSDVDNSNGLNTTATTTLSPGEDDRTWDMGITKCQNLAGDVWFDLNLNGIYDPNEKGINGLYVYLVDSTTGLVVERVTTSTKPGTPSDDGYYIFYCVRPGKYYIRFERPGHLAASLPYQGTNPLKDSDITHENGVNTTKTFDMIALAALATPPNLGDLCEHIGAGFQTKSSIGNTVWIDQNMNGIQDEGESPLPGVKVRAINNQGFVVSESMTQYNGQYVLDGISKGDYYLKFETPGQKYTFTRPLAGPAHKDSDVDGTFGYGSTRMMRIESGEVKNFIDAGVVAAVLAIDWMDFTAKYNGDFTELDWTTGVEVDNEYFVIQRKHESEKDFKDIGQVKAHPNPGLPLHEYNFEDFDINRTGKYFYRIKQVDKTGVFTMSKTVAVNIDAPDNLSAFIYPNPVTDIMKIELWLPQDGELELKVFDHNGKAVLVAPFNEFRVKGKYNDVFEMNHLIPGQYVLQIKSSSGVITKKFTVSR